MGRPCQGGRCRAARPRAAAPRKGAPREGGHVTPRARQPGRIYLSIYLTLTNPIYMHRRHEHYRTVLYCTTQWSGADSRDTGNTFIARLSEA
eukprot:scaffold204_cov215-Prasinococcus_capsulatus_cf.AAC.1